MEVTKRAAITALDLEGQPVRILDLASERPVVVCFLRHYG